MGNQIIRLGDLQNSALFQHKISQNNRIKNSQQNYTSSSLYFCNKFQTQSVIFELKYFKNT